MQPAGTRDDDLADALSADPAEARGGEQPVLPAAVEIRSVALFVLTVLAVVFLLQWAQVVFIPLMIGVMISYALSPVVEGLQRWHVPRALGAALLLGSILGGVVWLVWSLGDETVEVIETLPEAAGRFRDVMRGAPGVAEGPIESMQRAASELEEVGETVTDAPSPPSGVTRVQIEEPRLNVRDVLWTGTLGAAVFAGQACIVLLLAYFLLAAGDTFRRKLVRISGPTLTRKKLTLQVLREINAQIQTYLLVQVLTSVPVGIATWLAFLWIGVEHAAIWGVLAGVLNVIPYLGPVIVTAGAAVIAFLQFGTPGMALLVAGVSLLITSIEGYLLTPWLLGRAGRMNPVVVFVSLLFWGWLWGGWGLLLGVPIVMAVKTVCDHVEGLRPVGELLGD